MDMSAEIIVGSLFNDVHMYVHVSVERNFSTAICLHYNNFVSFTFLDGGESQDALEHSMVLDYEQRLVAKRVEVAELQQQRDKLLQTQKRLLELQGLISHVSL